MKKKILKLDFSSLTMKCLNVNDAQNLALLHTSNPTSRSKDADDKCWLVHGNTNLSQLQLCWQSLAAVVISVYSISKHLGARI